MKAIELVEKPNKYKALYIYVKNLLLFNLCGNI